MSTNVKAIKPPALKMTKREKHIAIAAYLFLLPNILGFITFTAFPVVASFVLSFFEWPVIQPPTFVGVDNYVRLFTKDPQFLLVLRNTVMFVIMYVPFNIVVAVALATWLKKDIFGIKAYRVLFFMPVLSSGVAVASIWKWIYQPDYGIINGILRSFGMTNLPKWIGDPKLALFSIVLMSLWWNVGYNTVIFIAGMKAIPQTLYEACDIDGASKPRRFFSITIPLLSPTLFYGIVMTLITSFQVFDQVYIMTDGGPMNATNTLVMYIYRNGFQWFNMGYAASMSWILFALIFGITLLNLRMQKNWVTYDL